MGEIIVVTSGKGGVGKTTTTANIGTALAMKGHSVVLLDADIGLRNLDVVMGLESRVVYDMHDYLKGVCRLEQALIKDKLSDGKLYLMPAPQNKDKDAISEAEMATLCQTLSGQFDYIIVDCPAGIEQGFKNAISAATRAFVVVTPELSSIRDADRVIGLLEARGLQAIHLLINRIRPEMIKRGDMVAIEDITAILAVKPIGLIPDDESIITSTNKGYVAVREPKSLAGKEYHAMVRRLSGEEVPVQLIQKKNYFKQSLKLLFSKGGIKS